MTTDERIKMLEDALRDAKSVLVTARKYFPKSIRNRDTFSLNNVISNSVDRALTRPWTELDTSTEDTEIVD